MGKDVNGGGGHGATAGGLQADALDKIDLEHAPMDEVWDQLKTSPQGLTSQEAEERINIFGQNKLEEKHQSAFLKFLSFLWNPLSWVMEMAALVAIVVANGQGLPPDWEDFVGIIILLMVNATLSFYEENNAGKAAAALMANLAPSANVLRDGAWKEMEATHLVPGDLIGIRGGDIIPADARLLKGEPLKVDQSALTGESLPVNKKEGDEVYSGSTCKQGDLHAVVIATGVHTFFGKAAHLVDTADQQGHFQKVLAMIGSFCIVSIFIGILIEAIVMFAIQKRRYRNGINNLLVLLIGGIPIAMPTVLSVTMAIGSHHLAKQGAIVKRMTAIEEMAGMDILCSDKTGTLTLNQLTVFDGQSNKEEILLLAARASSTVNQEAIDKAIVGTLEEPGQARAGITEKHFLPFNPTDKRAAITYTTEDGKMYRASKGAPEQVLELTKCSEDVRQKAMASIDKLAERGLRTLGVALQEIPDGNAEGPGGPWRFMGLLPLLDPPRHDTADTIEKALELGVNVKMITGDQLAIGKETARRLGMGSNIYPSHIMTGKEQLPPGTDLGELVEKADGFAGVYPEHKFNIVKVLQDRKHLVAMTGDGVNDAPALKKADIGIAVAGATDAAREAADIVLTEPGLSTIISAILRSRVIFQRMKNYTIYATAITIRVVVGFLLIALIWKYDFPPFMVLILAFLNDGTIMTISKDRVKPSQTPDSWKLREIFITGISLGLYQALFSVLFFLGMRGNLFHNIFGVKDISHSNSRLASALYLQVSIMSQALIFVTRAQRISYTERPGILLMISFIVAQLVATFISVYARWGFVPIRGIGWGWAGVIWLYDLIFYFPMDFIKLGVQYAMDGQMWHLMTQSKTMFTHHHHQQRKRQSQWAHAQRTSHGMQGGEKSVPIDRRYPAMSKINLDARRRAEIARLRERHTLRGHVESVLKMQNLENMDSVDKAYTL
eukprot:SM000008S22270  [mRNA]  locus=s8:700002:707007:- [translate_table: standard]